jgi:pimeloyl-ACP methyl ester carboxylesterase
MLRASFLLAALALTFLGSFAPVASSLAAPAAPAAAPAFVPKRFSVTVAGTGPDVILIPGLAGSRDVWRGSASSVPGYRYHFVQVAGFAGAPVAGNAKGDIVAPLAEEIARYIAAKRLVRPAIVGHSMGGSVAMMVAARHPTRVGKVMVVDMLPQPAGLLGGSASEMRGLADTLRRISSAPEGRGLVESAIRLFGGREAENSRSDPDVVARATHELAVTDLTPEIPRIAAPLTVVYAVLDPSRRVSTDRAWAAAYAPRRGTRLVRIEDSGHMIMYDQPAKFRDALRTFLAS